MAFCWQWQVRFHVGAPVPAFSVQMPPSAPGVVVQPASANRLIGLSALFHDCSARRLTYRVVVGTSYKNALIRSHGA